MALPQEKQSTYADMLTWSEEERVELIYGQPHMMAPPSRRHQEILTTILLQLGSFLKDKKCKVYPAPFGVRLFEREGDSPSQVDTLVEPDLTVVCDPDKLDDAGCKGAPDLIIEIISPSTQRHDRLVKYNLYQRAGVREYWILDYERNLIMVYDFEHDEMKDYTLKDKVKTNIYQDLEIDFSQMIL